MFGKFYLNSFSRQTFFIIISAKRKCKCKQNGGNLILKLKYFCAVSLHYTPWEFKWLNRIFTLISVEFVQSWVKIVQIISYSDFILLRNLFLQILGDKISKEDLMLLFLPQIQKHNEFEFPGLGFVLISVYFWVT